MKNVKRCIDLPTRLLPQLHVIIQLFLLYQNSMLLLASFYNGSNNFLADIEAKLRRIEEDPEGSGTTHLQKCIERVTSLATQAFEPLLERQVHYITLLWILHECIKAQVAICWNNCFFIFL